MASDNLTENLKTLTLSNKGEERKQKKKIAIVRADSPPSKRKDIWQHVEKIKPEKFHALGSNPFPKSNYNITTDVWGNIVPNVRTRPGQPQANSSPFLTPMTNIYDKDAKFSVNKNHFKNNHSSMLPILEVPDTSSLFTTGDIPNINLDDEPSLQNHNKLFSKSRVKGLKGERQKIFINKDKTKYRVPSIDEEGKHEIDVRTGFKMYKIYGTELNNYIGTVIYNPSTGELIDI